MSAEAPRRRIKSRKEQESEHQLSFLSPDDATMVLLLRRFVAEAARIYETKTGKALEDALTIRAPKDAYEFLRLEMEDLDQEQLRTINLNTRNRIVSTQMIYQGTINTTYVRIAELFRPAISVNAACIIVAHNHPSGDPTPSPEDVRLTDEAVRAGKLLGIEVVDHIIVGKGKYVSLKERGLGFA